MRQNVEAKADEKRDQKVTEEIVEVNDVRIRILRTLVEIEGENIWLLEVAPEQEHSEEVPVLVGPGFQQGGESFLPLMMQIASHGRRVISFTARHGVDPTGYREDIIEERGFPEEEYRKAAALIGVMEEIGSEYFDYVGISDGALNGAMSATAFPERFRNMILMSPVIGPTEDTSWNMLANYLREDAAIRRRRKDPDPGDERLNKVVGRDRYVWDRADSKQKKDKRAKGEPGFHSPATWKQLEAMALGRRHDLLRGLQEQGISVVVIYGIDDKSLPSDQYQEMLGWSSEMREHGKKGISGVITVKGGHDLGHQYPERMGALIDDSLRKLEQAREEDRKGAERQNADA